MGTKLLWIVAAVIAILVGAYEAASIIGVGRRPAVIDIIVLIVAGFLAGLFAGFVVMRRKHDGNHV